MLRFTTGAEELMSVMWVPDRLLYGKCQDVKSTFERMYFPRMASRKVIEPTIPIPTRKE